MEYASNISYRWLGFIFLVVFSLSACGPAPAGPPIPPNNPCIEDPLPFLRTCKDNGTACLMSGKAGTCQTKNGNRCLCMNGKKILTSMDICPDTPLAKCTRMTFTIENNVSFFFFPEEDQIECGESITLSGITGSFTVDIGPGSSMGILDWNVVSVNIWIPPFNLCGIDLSESNILLPTSGSVSLVTGEFEITIGPENIELSNNIYSTSNPLVVVLESINSDDGLASFLMGEDVGCLSIDIVGNLELPS